MKVTNYLAGLLLSFSTWVFAGLPVFTLTPLTPTTITVAATGTAIVQYTVTNQSTKTHTLKMMPITGVSQQITVGACASPFILASQQSCTLVLDVNGSQLTGNIVGGPKIYQQGPDGNPSPFLCYQPSAANSLNITVGGAATQYTVTPQAGTNGTIAPSTVQTVNAGSNLLFTAMPATNFQVNQWLVDGGVVQTGGLTFTLNNINANHTVLVTFTASGTLYSGSELGGTYYSTDNGATWTSTFSAPFFGSGGVTSVFATHNPPAADVLYAARGTNVNYTPDLGHTWLNITGPWLSSVTVNGIFVISSGGLVANNIIYVATSSGVIYYSINNGSTWTAAIASFGGTPANSVFVIPGGSISTNQVYVGLETGYVEYSTDNGGTWSNYLVIPDGSAIHNVFVTNTLIYVNTANENAYSNSVSTLNNPWTSYAQTVYSLFANSDGSIVDAGTQGGYAYSLSTGNELGFITQSPINSIYLLQ